MNLMMLETAATGAAAESNPWSMVISFVPLILIFVVFYFLLIRPQKKREKATNEMRNNIQVGDEVVTQGGIVGRVVSMKEDNIVIETGSERSKIRIKRWAIASNQTLHDEAEA
ncbi:MAG: preprotein translocase subunit YajC [Oscillospiraceae bacterium]|jgi:preprotein translocase subunit YajC